MRDLLNEKNLKYGKPSVSERIWTFLNYAFGISSVLFMTVPFIQAPFMGGLYALIMVATMGGWLFTSICLKPNWFLKITTTSVIAFLIFFLYLIFLFLGFGNIRQVAVVVVAPWYLFFIFHFYYSTDKKQVLGGFALIVLIAYIITVVTTIIGLAGDASSYREFESNTEMIAINSVKNIGDVNHIYSSVLIGTMLLCILQGKCIKNKFVKFFIALSAFLCFYLSLTCSTGIVIICAVVALVIVPLQRMGTVSKFFIISFLIIFVLFFKDSFGYFIQDFSSNIENEYVSGKIYDIGSSIVGGESTGDLKSRTDRWMMDFDTFINTYGIGIGPYYQGAGNGKYLVREHSQLFSDMARYGIIFLLVIVRFFFGLYKSVNMEFENNGIKCNYFAVYLVITIMYIAQPILLNFVIPTVIFLVIPASPHIINYINEKTPKNKNDISDN